MGSTIQVTPWDQAGDLDKETFRLTAAIAMTLLRESGRLLPPGADQPAVEWGVANEGHTEVWASESAAKTHAAAVNGTLLYRKRWPQHISKWMVP
jgi:hypothetical protein